MKVETQVTTKQNTAKVRQSDGRQEGISTTACVLESLLGLVKGLWGKTEKIKMHRRAGED